jgi:hypothetical protein
MNTLMNSFFQSYPHQDVNLYPQIAGALIKAAPDEFAALSNAGMLAAKPPG